MPIVLHSAKPIVFLCHASGDKEFVRSLSNRLNGDGIDTWFDEVQIKVGDSIHQKINEGLKRSDFLAVLLSKNSVGSKWVQEELSSASSLEKYQNEGVFVLPILIEDCEVPPLLLDRRYANFAVDADSAYRELVDAINHHFRARNPDFDADKFVKSLEIELGEERFIHLPTDSEHLSQLPPRMLERIVASVFSKSGFTTELTRMSRDGGFDIMATHRLLPGLLPETLIVNCKNWARPLGVDVVRAIAGVRENAEVDRAMLVASSTFTKPAQEQAKRCRIELVDGDLLCRWIRDILLHHERNTGGQNVS